MGHSYPLILLLRCFEFGFFPKFSRLQDDNSNGTETKTSATKSENKKKDSKQNQSQQSYKQT